jgi:hypothetical protein
VVGHEAVVPTSDGELVDGIAQDVQELTVVGIIDKDGHATVAASHHVAKEIWRLNPRCAWHAPV